MAMAKTAALAWALLLGGLAAPSEDIGRLRPDLVIWAGAPHRITIPVAGGEVVYEEVEPDRLTLQGASFRRDEAMLWITGPAPADGLDFAAPPSLGGRCEGLRVTAALKQLDVWQPLDGAAIDNCAVRDGKLRIHVKLPPLPTGPVLVTVRRRGEAGKPVS
jgi:hypothetical protein